MILKNFKIFFKNLLKNRIVLIGNIFGFSLAIASVLAIVLWSTYESNFDKNIKNVDNKYLIASKCKYANGNTDFIMETPPILAISLKEEVPEISRTLRYEKLFGGRFISYNDKLYHEEGIAAEATIFSFLSLNIIEGTDAENALSDKKSIIISEKLAHKIFGNVSPIGKNITINDDNFHITSVIEDIPDNNSFQFDFIISFFYNKNKQDLDSWWNWSNGTFVELNKNSNLESFQELLKGYIEKKADFGDMKIELYAHNLNEMHFNSDFDQFVSKTGKKNYVYILLTIAFFLLIVACINFVNLTTTQYSTRKKEMVVKRCLGGTRINMFFQFFLESKSVILVVFLLSFVIILITLPMIQKYAGFSVTKAYFENKYFFYLIIALFTLSILTSIYPAWFLSSSKLTRGKTKVSIFNMKNIFICLQFVLTISFLSSSIIIVRQLKYIQNKDLGYNKHNALLVPLHGANRNKVQLFKDEFNSYTDIISVTSCNDFWNITNDAPGWSWEGNETTESLSVSTLNIDNNFFSTIDIKLFKGESFSIIDSVAKNQVIINKKAQNFMGLNDPIGRKLKLGDKEYVIAGVTQDFNFTHLSNPIKPLLMFYKNNPNNLLIKVNPENSSSLILNQIKNFYNNINTTNYAFEAYSLEQKVDELYKRDYSLRSLILFFTILSILILSIGLFGLITYNIDLRKKELGIRKVLGAEVPSIINLLLRDIIFWFSIAIIISVPITYYYISNWLNNFEYRISIALSDFLIAGTIMLISSSLAILIQVYKAAVQNPIIAIKYE